MNFIFFVCNFAFFKSKTHQKKNLKSSATSQQKSNRTDDVKQFPKHMMLFVNKKKNRKIRTLKTKNDGVKSCN